MDRRCCDISKICVFIVFFLSNFKIETKHTLNKKKLRPLEITTLHKGSCLAVFQGAASVQRHKPISPCTPLPFQVGRCFQSVLKFQWIPEPIGFLMDKEAGGARSSRLLRETTEEDQEEEATSSCCYRD